MFVLGVRSLREVRFDGTVERQKQQLKTWEERSPIHKATFNANTNWEPKIYMNRPDRTILQAQVKSYVKRVMELFGGNTHLQHLYITTVMERGNDSPMVEFAKAAFNDYLRRYINLNGKNLAKYSITVIDIRGAYYRTVDAEDNIDREALYCKKNMWRGAQPDLVHRNSQAMTDIFVNYIAPVLKQQ